MEQQILQPPQYFQAEEEKMVPEAKFEQNQKQFFLTYSKCNLGIKEIHYFFTTKFNNIQRYLIAEEKHKDGTPHIHAYLELKKKIHIRSARFFDYKGFHPNNAGAIRNPERVTRYCVKDQDGYPNFVTNMPLHEVFKPPKLLKVKEYATMNEDQLSELNPATYNMVQRSIQLHRKITGYDPRPDQLEPFKYPLLPWQKQIINILEQPCHGRKIFWFFDEIGGLGKTTFASYLTSVKNSFYLKINRKEDILFRVGANIKLFVFDIPRTGGRFVNYDLIETLKDGKWEYGKYEGGTVRRDSPAFVFCFANCRPVVSNLSLDRWVIKELKQDGSSIEVDPLQLQSDQEAAEQLKLNKNQ